MVEKLVDFHFKANKKIITEGENGELCYFIKEGNVVCVKNNKIISTISKGGYFGEQALLANSLRTATVIAETNVNCIGLNRNHLEEALGSQLEKVILLNSINIAFSRSELFSKLDKTQKNKIIEGLQIIKYPSDSLVIEENTSKKSKIWLVLHGKLKTSTEIFADSFMCIGDSEISSNSDEYFNENIYAAEDTDIGVIIMENVLECIGYNKCNLTIEDIKALKKINILRELPSGKLKEIIRCLNREKFSNSQVIVEQNTPGDQLFLIQSGTVDIIKDGVILRSITKNDYFGERSLLFDEVRTASAVAQGEVYCWVLSKQDFISNLHEISKKIIMKRIEMQDCKVKLSDLKYLKVLGKGAFGTVFLVAEIKTHALYALKVISKKKVERYGLHDYIILERNILKALNHPFILKLITNFEDSKKIYLLTEYVNGLNLYDLIRNSKHIPEENSKFYIACLILILEYLHERNIVYRDLKPENIRVEDDGYLKLLDFGSSKAIEERAYTVIGTPHFMAPEMILGQGYGFNADY